MNIIKFLGAAGTVTGSCYMLYDDETGRGILIDMGMFQGLDDIVKLNYNQLAFDATKLDGVLLTHAHLDHCGRLPILARAGFNGKIFMTEATRMLAELTLFDTAKIAREDTVSPIYTDVDVETILSQTQIVYYHQKFRVSKYEIEYIDAGHILGSASIIITDPSAPEGNNVFVFSGDIGNYPEDLVKQTEFPDHADVVVMESTYGDRVHTEGVPMDILQEEVNTIENTRSTLLIPAFSLEKTQELLHLFYHLKKDGKVAFGTPVYVDSPMAIRATLIYKQFSELYNDELAGHAKSSDPFAFPGLSMVLKASKSKKIKQTNGAKVIIAGGGMMTGGRILQHARDYISQSDSRLLITGYQGENTLGREIEEGAENILIRDQEVKVRANIRKMNGMSSHADKTRLINWLHTIKNVKKVFLAHGEDTSRTALKTKIQTDLDIQDVNLPQLNEVFELK